MVAGIDGDEWRRGRQGAGGFTGAGVLVAVAREGRKRVICV